LLLIVTLRFTARRRILRIAFNDVEGRLARFWGDKGLHEFGELDVHLFEFPD